MPDGSATAHAVRADDAYRAFLEAKVELAEPAGIDVPLEDLPAWLMPHAKIATRWMLLGGCRAVFASFGLHKTSMQLAACWTVLKWLWASGEDRARGLIVMPLGVRQEFIGDAAMMAIPVTFVRSTLECWGPGLYLTNYESFRDGKIDFAGFDVVSLDEAACLRSMGGSKTFRVAANSLKSVRFKFVATAMPSPNEHVEILAQAEVLGIMDIGQAKTRFFKRDSQKADQLTLHPHKEREFWLWVASWALFITKPSDLGCSDEGYERAPRDLRWHRVAVPPPYVDLDEGAGGAKSGQQLEMFRSGKVGIVGHAREKRATMFARVAKMVEIIAEDPDDHYLLWHDLNDERDLIAEACPDAFVVDGALDDSPGGPKEQRILGFRNGAFAKLAAKPSMLGAGVNFQRHCHRAIFVGVGFKFHDWYQAVHRIDRFGQAHGVRIDCIYAESEQPVVDELLRRLALHEEMVETMTEIIREYGLSAAAMADALKRSMGVERIEARGGNFQWPAIVGPSGPPDPTPAWTIVHEDCCREVARMPANSVDLIVTSIPFATQYEYSPNYADMGHTDDNDHFWAQMGFLIPELLRVLKPGRDACIHVKDRIVPGGLTGLGFQTLQPFGDECRYHFRKAGFAYLGTITNVTDVVRENNQTYRLGWSEQLKDGTRMGCGVPEQVILLRKPPSDLSNGYADEPVVKHRQAYVWTGEGASEDGSHLKFGGHPPGSPAPYDRQAEQCGAIRPVEATGYSRGRWQLDASAFRRSAGDRLLKPHEWLTFENMDAAFQLWRDFNLDEVYDFEQHVLINERFDALGKLPAIFQLLPTHSWHAAVWTDIAQMRSLNTEAARRKLDSHLCPLPFDIVDRLITQRSMPGELVFDPFAGIGTVPYCALKLGRRGAGVELSPEYFAAAAKNCAIAEEASRVVPTLFDALEARCFEAAEGVAA